MKKILFLLSIIATLFFFDSCSAPYVRNKPSAFEAQRPPSPSPNHVWVDGDWRWKKQSHTYMHQDGQWQRPNRGRDYRPGHWKSSRFGYKWKSGSWK